MKMLYEDEFIWVFEAYGWLSIVNKKLYLKRTSHNDTIGVGFLDGVQLTIERGSIIWQLLEKFLKSKDDKNVS